MFEMFMEKAPYKICEKVFYTIEYIYFKFWKPIYGIAYRVYIKRMWKGKI